MSRRRFLEYLGFPIKKSMGAARRIKRNCLFWVTAFSLLLAGAPPAWAQNSPVAAIPPLGEGLAASLGSFSWVQVTFAAISTVLGGWILSTGLLWTAGRLHWVTQHQLVRLTRALQVTMGGLLLTAVLLPYLVEHHPIVAIFLPVMGMLAMVGLSMRTNDLIDQNPSI